MKKVIFAGICFAAVVAAGIAVYLNTSPQDPRSALEDFLDLIGEGQSRQAYDKATAGDFRDKMSYDDFGKFLDSYFMLGDTNQLLIQHENIQSEQADLDILATVKGEVTLEIQVELQKYRRRWLISDLQVLGITFPGGEDPRQTLEQFKRFLLSGKLPESYEMFSFEAKSYTAWEDYVQMFAYFPYVSDIQFDSQVLKQYDLFEAVGSFEYNGQDYEIEVIFAKNRNLWQVNTARIYEM